MIVGLIDKSMFNFVRNCQAVFQRDCTIFHFTETLCCSTSSSPLDMVGLINFSYSNRCEVVFHFGFHLHFPNDKICWSSFICLLAIFLPFS